MIPEKWSIVLKKFAFILERLIGVSAWEFGKTVTHACIFFEKGFLCGLFIRSASGSGLCRVQCWRRRSGSAWICIILESWIRIKIRIKLKSLRWSFWSIVSSRIRIRIKLKGRIRIRILVKSRILIHGLYPCLRYWKTFFTLLQTGGSKEISYTLADQ